MQRSRQWCVVVLFVMASVAFSSGWSLGQDKEGGKAADKGASKATKEPAAPKGTKLTKDTKRRLPRYYGKLGLSEAQREKIYGVQEKYAAEINKLEKQLEDLKDKQEADCRKVLSADQKKQLGDAVEAAKAKAKTAPSDDEMEG